MITVRKARMLHTTRDYSPCRTSLRNLVNLPLESRVQRGILFHVVLRIHPPLSFRHFARIVKLKPPSRPHPVSNPNDLAFVISRFVPNMGSLFALVRSQLVSYPACETVDTLIHWESRNGFDDIGVFGEGVEGLDLHEGRLLQLGKVVAVYERDGDEWLLRSMGFERDRHC